MKMDKLMRQAQKMQEQMLKIQEELANETVEGESGGGVVKVNATDRGIYLYLDRSEW